MARKLFSKTPARDATHAPLLRAKIREVMRMAPARKLDELILLDSVKLLGMEATIEELREQLLWNQSSGFVDYIFNRDRELDEWFLTERGRAKK